MLTSLLMTLIICFASLFGLFWILCSIPGSQLADIIALRLKRKDESDDDE